jgi:hypothetical protein
MAMTEDTDRGLRAVANALDAELKAPRIVREIREKHPNAREPLAPIDYAPPEARPDTVTKALGPLPDYVTHAPDVSRSAAIAAHAVVVDYEKSATTLEALGREYHEQAQAVIQKVIDTARLIREKGAEAFREVEMSSKVGTEVVGVINDLKVKMNLNDRLVSEALANIDPPVTPAKTESE